MKGFALFLVGFLCSFASFAQPTLLSFDLKSYGPFLKEYEDEFSLSVENLGSAAVNVKVEFALTRFGTVLMETGAGLSPVVEALPQLVTSYEFYDDDGYDPFVFHNQAFKDSLDSFLMPINSHCRIAATLFYDLGEGFIQSNTQSVQVEDVLPTPIASVFPKMNDTLYLGREVYSFYWDDLKLAPGYETKYAFKLYEVSQNQTVSQALMGTPLADEVLDVANSYKWQPVAGNDTVIWDSVYGYSRHFVWVVKNVIPSGFGQSTYDTEKISEFYLDKIPLPTFSAGDDTMEFYSKCYAKGFEKHLVDEMSWDTPVPFTGSKVYSSYKNLSCVNGGAENGTFEGWTGAVGEHLFEKRRSQVVLNSPGFNFDPNDPENSDHFIYSLSEPDFFIGDDLRTISPRGGNYSMRVGDQLVYGAEAVSLEYTFLVNSGNEDFEFIYALVMEDPDGEGQKHRDGELPFFSYLVENITDDEMIAEYKVLSDEDNTEEFGRKENGGDVFLYKNWTCVGVDLSAYNGKQIKVTFLAADCSQGGHFCYAYVDGLCETSGPVPHISMANEFCVEDNMVADGSGTTYEMDYRWSLEVSDEFSGRNPSTEVYSKWFLGQEVPSQVSISQLAKDLGFELECDKYYRIKLIARNNCSDYQDDVHLMYIKPCFEVDAGPDRSICFNETDPQLIGTIYSSPYPSGYSQTTFSWSHNASIQLPYDYVLPSASITTYTLTATLGTNGCISKDSVDVFVQDGPNYAVGLTDDNLCDSITSICVEIYSYGKHRIFINGVNPGVGFDHDLDGPGTFCFDDIDFGGNQRQDVFFTIVDECTSKSATLTFANFDTGNPAYLGDPEIPFNVRGTGATLLNPRGANAPIYEKELFIWDVHNFTYSERIPISPLNAYAYNAYAARLEFFHKRGTNVDEKSPLAVFVFEPRYGMGLYNGQINYDLMFNGAAVEGGRYPIVLHLNRCGSSSQNDYNWYPKKWVVVVQERPCMFCKKVDTVIESTSIAVKVD